MQEQEKTFDKVKYNNSFNKEQYDRVSLMLPKGKKDIIKEHAQRNGESTNAFINRAIDEAMKRDSELNPGEEDNSQG